MNLKLKLLSLPATLFLFSLVSAQTPPAELKDGDLKFEPFTISYEGQNVIAELGRLVVRENRSNPSTRLIELAFVRLKSTAEKPGYPVVYLDGGPGSSAINIARVPDYMRAFMKLREVGDVILLDQRGVGRSKPNLSRLSSEPSKTIANTVANSAAIGTPRGFTRPRKARAFCCPPSAAT